MSAARALEARSEGAGEVAEIAAFLSRSRAEIAALTPRGVRHGGLRSAGAELDAVVRDAQTATNAILDAVETALTLVEPGDRERLTAELMKVLVACSFQDVTGQRVRKAVDALVHVEARLTRLAEALATAPAPAPAD